MKQSIYHWTTIFNRFNVSLSFLISTAAIFPITIYSMDQRALCWYVILREWHSIRCSTEYQRCNEMKVNSKKHSIIQHPAMFVNPNSKDVVVIIGWGGEGAIIICEIYKHNRAESVVMMEADEMSMRISYTWMIRWYSDDVQLWVLIILDQGAKNCENFCNLDGSALIFAPSNVTTLFYSFFTVTPWWKYWLSFMMMYCREKEIWKTFMGIVVLSKSLTLYLCCNDTTSITFISSKFAMLAHEVSRTH